ncbi:cystine/glutamate transporter-like isoform X2 [Strongylocentrotus purpuratus]|uniref:Cystine/glutamate transporter n=1 Tax=Strongylocentrotus purpuratus TaxID=7668 RepID=A0A7M7SU38_STRPU|nr:cystine/glutamate transporter-like isoform X2 [Strongylocentrotus purpuratus]
MAETAKNGRASGLEESNDTGSDKVVLARSLGLKECVSMVMGIIIGTGIFISPKGVLAGAGGSPGWSLIMWVICAVISLFGALCYAELSTTFKKSGGEFTFILQAFGPLLAFLRMWTYLFIILPAVAIVQGNTIANYITAPFFNDCEEVPTHALRLMGMAVIFMLAFINAISVKLTTRLVNILTVAKTVGLIVLIISGLVYLAKGHTQYLNPENSFKMSLPLNIPLAIFAGIFAFDGWESVNTIVEEIKKPERNVPLGIVISLSAVTIIYLMANIAYFTLLSPAEILASNAVAADYSVLALGNWSWTIWVFVALSAMGNLIGSWFGFSRMFYVAAREGLLPSVVGMISVKHRTPIPSVIIVLPITLIYLMFDDVIALINYMLFVIVAFMALTVLIIPYYRWKHPNMERTLKLPLVIPIIFILVILFLMGLSVYTDPFSALIGTALTVAGIPVYFVGCVWNKPVWLQEKIVALNLILQKFFFVVPQEKEMVSESDDDADDKVSKSNGYRSAKEFEDVPLN